MELIYIWRSKYKNGVLSNEGISLSERYNINMISNDGNPTFVIEENKNYYNLFFENNIQNVTAIVGNNGSGKSSLLDTIYNNTIFSQSITNNKGNISLCVYLIDNNIFVFHNFENDITILGIKHENIINMNKEKMYRTHYMNEGVLNKITTCFVTNSFYQEHGTSVATKEQIPDNFRITPDYLKSLAYIHNRKTLKYFQGIESNEYIIKINEVIFKNTNEKNFYNICDLLYYNNLHKQNSLNSYTGKIADKIEIYFIKLPGLLNELINSGEVELEEKHLKKVNRWLTRNFEENGSNDFLNQIKVNLLFELDILVNIDEEKNILKIDEFLLSTFNNLEEIIENEKILEYYKSAFLEIKEFELLFTEIDKGPNSGIIDQLIHTPKKIIDKNKMEDVYIKFLDAVEKLENKEFSFILKYINILDLGMSSGERALLNIFKSLNLISFYSELNPAINSSVRENILLLIDELDLYCHPEWQVNMISYLLSELENQFPNNRIQIIFTTHSPILLSDIPLSNTIYLQNSDGKTKVLSKKELPHTFAANIYSLFDNSFFLKDKGVTGAYSRKIINSVYSNLREKLENPNYEMIHSKKQIQYIIDSIGEPLIRNKLLKMYNEVYIDGTENIKSVKEQLSSILESGLIRDNNHVENLREILKNI